MPHVSILDTKQRRAYRADHHRLFTAASSRLIRESVFSGFFIERGQLALE